MNACGSVLYHSWRTLVQYSSLQVRDSPRRARGRLFSDIAVAARSALPEQGGRASDILASA
eukprot:5225866-Lingulodinium_polyedra.AAC.1